MFYSRCLQYRRANRCKTMDTYTVGGVVLICCGFADVTFVCVSLGFVDFCPCDGICCSLRFTNCARSFSFIFAVLAAFPRPNFLRSAFGCWANCSCEQSVLSDGRKPRLRSSYRCNYCYIYF